MPALYTLYILNNLTSNPEQYVALPLLKHSSLVAAFSQLQHRNPTIKELN